MANFFTASSIERAKSDMLFVWCVLPPYCCHSECSNRSSLLVCHLQYFVAMDQPPFNGANCKISHAPFFALPFVFVGNMGLYKPQGIVRFPLPISHPPGLVLSLSFTKPPFCISKCIAAPIEQIGISLHLCQLGCLL